MPSILGLSLGMEQFRGVWAVRLPLFGKQTDGGYQILRGKSTIGGYFDLLGTVQ